MDREAIAKFLFEALLAGSKKRGLDPGDDLSWEDVGMTMHPARRSPASGQVPADSDGVMT
jgi:hypothetical protein